MKWHVETCTDPLAFPRLLAGLLCLMSFSFFSYQLVSNKQDSVSLCNDAITSALALSHTKRIWFQKQKKKETAQKIICYYGTEFLNFRNTTYFCLDLKLLKYGGKREGVWGKEKIELWISHKTFLISTYQKP